ncbi:WhiB family transcriptional regulator [Kitasatospora sp. NPDC056076]|uniref:WhiB family transcriptional regulator n=1 Tax=Kitasatospora sp. NPDC056076 TaxID=3345703 RepID=UPI0035D6916A
MTSTACKPPAGSRQRSRAAAVLLKLMAEAIVQPYLACRYDPNIWYSTRQQHLELAARRCRGDEEGYPRCPLLEMCRAAGRLGGENHGVWGGETPRQRRRAKARQQAAQKKEESPSTA